MRRLHHRPTLITQYKLIKYTSEVRSRIPRPLLHYIQAGLLRKCQSSLSNSEWPHFNNHRSYALSSGIELVFGHTLLIIKINCDTGGSSCCSLKVIGSRRLVRIKTNCVSQNKILPKSKLNPSSNDDTNVQGSKPRCPKSGIIAWPL
jgi:hypothetical protein